MRPDPPQREQRFGARTWSVIVPPRTASRNGIVSSAAASSSSSSNPRAPPARAPEPAPEKRSEKRSPKSPDQRKFAGPAPGVGPRPDPPNGFPPPNGPLPRARRASASGE